MLRVSNYRLLYRYTGQRPYPMEQCKPIFKTANSIIIIVCYFSSERHIMDHTGERPYPCEQCKQSFKTANSLKKHKLSVHSDVKQFSCQFCLSRSERRWSGILLLLKFSHEQRCWNGTVGAATFRQAEAGAAQSPATLLCMPSLCLTSESKYKPTIFCNFW
jgi:hypothetical protein